MVSRDELSGGRHDERVTAASTDRLAPGTSSGWARACAVLVAILSFAALVTGLGLHLANRGSPTTVGVTDWWLMPLVAGLSFASAGAWLVWVRPRLSIGWLSLAAGALNTVMSACLEYGVWALDRPHGTPLATWIFWFGNWAWVTSLLLIATVLPLLLPDGRLASRHWRVALALSAVVVGANSLSWAFGTYESWSPALAAAGVVNPVGVDWVSADAVAIPLALITMATIVVACSSLVVRLRHSSDVQRQQLKWILFGLVLTLTLFAAGFAYGPTFTALAMVPLPAACLVAVLRYRLWDVDIVVSRSLLYVGLITAVVVLYIACVGLLGRLLGDTMGAPLIATAVVAVCVEPLHRRLRALVNRLVYGEPDDPLTVLARVGQRLESARDGVSVADEVLPEVVTSVAAALRLPYVAVALVDGATIEHGTPSATLTRIPLTYGGQQVGTLLYAPRTDGVGRTDRRLLNDLARHAAIAAHTVMLTRDLARSREQLVTAREEERRRLYRELHDGLGPSLAALALQVETARDLTPLDPVAAHVLLERATPRLKTTVNEVRTVIQGLRPAALDELGLAAALRELGCSFASPGFAVSVQVADVVALPAAVEVAAYRIAAEALTNAARHSRGGSACLRVEQWGSTLLVSVHDDGGGCPPDPSGNGLGIASMRERALELGGTFALQTCDGGRGTRMEATLPVAQP